MNIINPSVELCIEEGLKKIELIGKVCTKKEHNITEDSAPKFVLNRIKEGHTAILLHEHVYFNISGIDRSIIKDLIFYNRYIHISNNGNYIALSYRTILDLLLNTKRNNRRINLIEESNIIEDIIGDIAVLTPELNNLFYNYDRSNYGDGSAFKMLNISRVDKRIILIEAPELYFVTFKFICDRAIGNEIVRHGEISPMQESTRWCDYSKNNDINYISPLDDNNVSEQLKDDNYNDISETFYDAIVTSEQFYKDLRGYGVLPQIARNVLPLALKTEMFMTGSLEMWYGEHVEQQIGDIIIKEAKGFIPQRTSKSAHPQIRTLAYKAKQLLDINFGKYYESK